MSEAESAHAPRLVDWTENMAAAERAGNVRKWGMSNSQALKAILNSHVNVVTIVDYMACS